jgi:hypothetical protein
LNFKELVLVEGGAVVKLGLKVYVAKTRQKAFKFQGF